jgi:hypothetical protein
VGTIFHLTARVRCPFPVSIASLEEHLESVVIVPTSLEKATATSPATPPSSQPRTVHHQPHLTKTTKTMVMPAARMRSTSLIVLPSR